MGFKQHISRTWQMIEQQVNDVPFRPHHEAPGKLKKQKSPELQWIPGFCAPSKIHLTITLTSNDAKTDADVVKSHMEIRP